MFCVLCHLISSFYSKHLIRVDSSAEAIDVSSMLLNMCIMFFKAPEPPKSEEPVVQPPAAKVTPSAPERLPAKGIDYSPSKSSIALLHYFSYLFSVLEFAR